MVKKKIIVKKPRKTSVIRTYNANTWTSAMFWQMIRSALRNRTRFWQPKINCIKDARRPSQSGNKRLKWEFQCFDCKQYFSQKDIEAHHSKEAGKLNSYEDLPEFVRNLFAENGWIALCKSCHQARHLASNILKEEL